MDFKDYYKTLGLEKTATEKEIKDAFKKLAKKYHPDLNKNDKSMEEKFKEVNEAYEVLSDPDKRAKYDNLGSSYSRFRQTGGNPNDFAWNDWFAGQQNQGKRGYQTVGDFFDSGGGLSDFFERIFGSAKSASGGFSQQQGFKRTPKAGEDINTELEITLEEAFKGASKLISVGKKKLELKIKPGTYDGLQVRISGQGNKGRYGGDNGDLMIKISIIPHPSIERKADDLYIKSDIDLYTMILGGPAEISTLGGTLRVNISPESQQGKLIKLKGQGMPRYNSNDRGDLYISLNVVLPSNLSSDEKELFKKLKDLKN